MLEKKSEILDKRDYKTLFKNSKMLVKEKDFEIADLRTRLQSRGKIIMDQKEIIKDLTSKIEMVIK